MDFHELGSFGKSDHMVVEYTLAAFGTVQSQRHCHEDG